jgi:hypothetical protein
MTRRAFFAVAGLPFVPSPIARRIHARPRRNLLDVTLAQAREHATTQQDFDTLARITHEWREQERNLHVSMPPDLLRQVEEASRSEHITVDEWLRRAVEFHLSQLRARRQDGRRE